MRLISNQAWREAIDLLNAYKRTAVDSNNTREVNRRRRAGLLVGKLLKAIAVSKSK